MSREIKFRLWDIDQKRFISSNDERLFFEFEAGHIYQDGTNVTEYYTLLQFTGLQDKNGKEIYEGDVVTWYNSDGAVRTDQVLWRNGGLVLCNSQYTVGSYANLEIIGNIYENPEPCSN